MQSFLVPRLRINTLSVGRESIFLLQNLGICWNLLNNDLIFHHPEGGDQVIFDESIISYDA